MWIAYKEEEQFFCCKTNRLGGLGFVGECGSVWLVAASIPSWAKPKTESCNWGFNHSIISTRLLLIPPSANERVKCGRSLECWCLLVLDMCQHPFTFHVCQPALPTSLHPLSPTPTAHTPTAAAGPSLP